MMLLATITTGNAQFFAEGSFGMSYSEDSASENGITLVGGGTNFSWNVSSLLGYQLNEKIAVGAKIFFYKKIRRWDAFDDIDNEIKSEDKNQVWCFSVLNRYKLWSMHKLTLLLESSVFIDKYNTDRKGLNQNWSNQTEIGINAVPLVTYNLSDKFSLITNCNFLNFQLRTEILKTNGGIKTKHNVLSFGGSSEIFTSLSNINLGLIYKF